MFLLFHANLENFRLIICEARMDVFETRPKQNFKIILMK